MASFLLLFVCYLLAYLLLFFLFCFPSRFLLNCLDLLTIWSFVSYKMVQSRISNRQVNFQQLRVWSSVDVIRFSFSFRQVMHGPNIMGRSKHGNGSFIRLLLETKEQKNSSKLTSFCSISSLKGFPCTKGEVFNSKSEEVTVLKD